MFYCKFQSPSVVQENVAVLFCCEAAETLRTTTLHMTSHQHDEGEWAMTQHSRSGEDIQRYARYLK